jgi:phenylpropionate dioxygenase-like ring-hydroxylating dioxygenase large terminal subunit
MVVARAEAIARPGDYAVFDVAGESVIVVRGRDGRLHAHYNVCRHRGSQLVRPPERGSPQCSATGDFRGAIRCPYHAWAYEYDGTLLSAPFLDAAEGREPFSLYPVAVDVWGGFVFVNLSPEVVADGRTLAAQLGPVPERLARYPLAELRVAHSIRYDVAANWKVLLENYNECYHCAVVHPELCRIVPAFKRRGGADLDWDRGIPHREGAFTFTPSGTTERAPFNGLDEDEKVRHKGELIYPNFMLSLAAEHVAAFALWPRGPAETAIVCEFLFHPDEIAKPSFDPSDAVLFWDLVNRQDWAICESLQRGMSSRRFRFGYYAPMESASLDIRRYIAERLGEAAVRVPAP